MNILTPSTEDGATVDIYTYFPFTKNYCEEVHPQIYNKFNLKTGFEHRDLPHFPNKVKNLHNCSLKVSTLEVPPFNLCRLKPSGEWSAWGLEGIFMTVMSHEISAILNRTFTHKRIWGNSSAQNAVDRALEMVENGKVNMSIGFMTSSRQQQSKMAATYSYYTTNLVWVIGAGKPLTAIQIFSKPFQRAVWFFIVVSMLVGFMVIGCVKCVGGKVRRFN